MNVILSTLPLHPTRKMKPAFFREFFIRGVLATAGILVLFASSAQSIQENRILTYDAFREIVLKYHPVALQASLQTEFGDAAVRQARGGFDPAVESGVSQKYFSEKTYYSLTESGLYIPTWFGASIKGGYERNTGDYLNPQNTVPDAGLWYAGISVPVGQGLFIDERRAALRKAQVYNESTQAERKQMINELLFEAAVAYWEWFASYHQQRVYEEAEVVAKERLQAVIQTSELGDRPFMDTLEAGIQVQERQLSLAQARLEFQNKTLKLSTFLWFENNIPLEVSEGTIPPAIELMYPEPQLASPLTERFEELISRHPSLSLYRYQIDGMRIEERWKKEQLKPTLNIEYNPISRPIRNEIIPSYSLRNYTWGLSFRMPLLLRKERGSLETIRLRIREKEYELTQQNLTLRNTARAALNAYQTAISQVSLYQRTTDDYSRLLSAEKTLFDNGESSLFMINSREMGFIQANLKLIQLVTEGRKALAKADYTLAVIDNP